MKRLGFVVAAGMLLFTSLAVAQDATTLVFGQYYRCAYPFGPK